MSSLTLSRKGIRELICGGETRQNKTKKYVFDSILRRENKNFAGKAETELSTVVENTIWINIS